MKMTVDLKEHSYPIYIERGILEEAAERIAEIKCIPVETVLKVAALNAARLFGNALKLN